MRLTEGFFALVLAKVYATRTDEEPEHDDKGKGQLKCCYG
jgi:hypothetical protein